MNEVMRSVLCEHISIGCPCPRTLSMLRFAIALSLTLLCAGRLPAQSGPELKGWSVGLPQRAGLDRFSFSITDVQTVPELKNIRKEEKLEKPLVPPGNWRVVTLITVLLEAKDAGAPYLAPELFLLDESFNYRPCQALRVQQEDGKWPNEWTGSTAKLGATGVTAFMPWQMSKGSKLYLQLAFLGDVSKGQHLLVAQPTAELTRGTGSQQ